MSEEFDFKSSGEKSTSVVYTGEYTTRPIGIKTPIQFGTAQSGFLQMNFEPADQVHDNLKNLLLTNHGERLGRYDFGADLKSLSFDLTMIPEFEQAAAYKIKEAVSLYMPFIELEDMDVQTVNHNEILPDGMALVKITVKYSIPKLKVIQKAIQALVYVGG